MARTVDELVVKMTVDGTAQLNLANESLKSIDKTTRAFNTRTLSANIQDIAVQAELGVSGLRILGQQGSEVLAAFGPKGAAAGAALAVGIALARPALSALGFDLRNITEMITDLGKANNAFLESQKQNQSSLIGMGNSYGALTKEAKDFFEVKQQIFQLKSEDESSRAVKELVKDFGFLTEATLKNAQARMENARLTPGFAGGGTELLGLQLRAKWLGLTAEQAVVVGEKLQDLDKKSPNEVVSTISDILKYLKELGPQTDGFRRSFEKVMDPLLKVNEELVKSKTNIKEAGQEASRFNTLLLESQATSLVDIGNARRSFNQVKVFGLEAQQKIAEFTEQANQKSLKDGVDRAKEIAAFENKTNAESLDKQKDFGQAQSETFKSSLLNNEAKRRQLEIESAIITLKDKGLFSSEYNLKYEEDILRNSKEYKDTLVGIEEQRRKNQISAQGAVTLEAQAAAIRDKSNGIATQTRDAAVRSTIIKSDMENTRKSIEDQIARYGQLGNTLRSINEQKIDINFAKGQIGKGGLDQQFAKITEDARKAAQSASQAFSEGFNMEDGLTPEKAQEMTDGLALIKKGYDDIAAAQIANLESSRTWSAGWKEATADYLNSANDSAAMAKTAFESATKGMEDAIVKFAMTGKLSFNDMANSIIADIIRIAARRAIASTFAGPLSFLGLAEGGPVSANTPYIVGEKGPEMFVPTSAGNIVPNDQLSMGRGMGNGDTNVTYNINAMDASSFRSMVARDPQFIYNITEVGRRSTPSRRLA